MESHEIAKFIVYFNAVAVNVISVFAVCGIAAVSGRALGRGIFRKRIFLRAFCVAALAAFALEATVFNFQHYLKWFAGPELETLDILPENPGFLRTSDAGYTAEIVLAKNGNGILFRNIDRKVTSIFVDVDYGDADRGTMSIIWTDEEGTRGFDRTLYRWLPHENYAVIQPHGAVSELKVNFGYFDAKDKEISLIQVVLNRQIPFYFSGLRLMAVSLLIFAAFVFLKKELRAKTSYLLFEYKFDPASKRQTLVYALSVVLLILFSWLSVYTSRYNKSEGERQPWTLQYNKYLVDAIIEGRVWLDAGNPEKLLDAERPYDYDWKKRNGNVENVDWMFDWGWYKGKHYCYYGVVPALLLYVPYKLATGNYLSVQTGIFLFASVSIILLAALWRYCVRRWMPEARFAFFLFSFLVLYFASGYFVVLSFTRFYSILQTAGFMFAVAGILLLLKSVENEKTSLPTLFFACLCLALVVGCRPNMVFVSLLVPALLWKRRSWKLLLPVLVPYALVAIPLCMYNYARFDSIFDFGQKHVLTVANLQALNSLNPIGLVFRMFISFISYWIFPNEYSLEFPYVTCVQQNLFGVKLGFFGFEEGFCGMVNFPVVFCLFYLLKKHCRNEYTAKAIGVVRAFLIIAVSIIALNSWMNGFLTRFMLDFTVFVILPSLFCAYFWSVCPGSEVPGKPRLKVVYILLAVSVFVGLALFATGGMRYIKDPTWYRYLEYSLGFIRDV